MPAASMETFGTCSDSEDDDLNPQLTVSPWHNSGAAPVSMHKSFIQLDVISMRLHSFRPAPHLHSSSNMSIQISLSLVARNRLRCIGAHFLTASSEAANRTLAVTGHASRMPSAVRVPFSRPQPASLSRAIQRQAPFFGESQHRATPTAGVK